MSIKQAAALRLTENEMAGIMAAREATVAPYRALASHIATRIVAGKQLGEKAKEGKKSLWDTFKQALNVAHKASHSPAAMADGLSLACAELEVPAGSYRSYVATTSTLYGKVIAGSLELTAALGLTIKDARELCQSDEAKRMNALKAKFAKITEDYTEQQWADLITLIAPATEEGEEEEGEAEAVAPVMPTAAAA
jgi:hypothetical protein